MTALQDEAEARWNLAESYRAKARRHLALAASRDAAPAVRTDRTDPDPRDHAALAAEYFDRALAEYRETQKRDPTSFDALTRYAHVFWEWRHAKANALVRSGPGLDHAEMAESSARRAVAAVRAKQIGQDGGADRDRPASPPDPAAVITTSPPANPALERSSRTTSGTRRKDAVPSHLRPAAATAYASLGAVLVAQMRPHEAIEQLESAQLNAPRHPSFDHVRWMLAQAHLCAASQAFREWRDETTAETRKDKATRRQDDPRLEAIGYHRDEARAPLDVIRAHERSRESPGFARFTDIARTDQICRKDWITEAMERERPRVRYALKQIPSTNYRSVCGWQGVGMKPPKGWRENEKEPLILHIWGGNVDERVLVNGIKQDQVENPDRPRRQDPIPIDPTRKPSYYFARLEDGAHRPVSMPVALTDTSPGPPLKGAPALAASVPARGEAPQAASKRCPDVTNLIQLPFEPMGTAVANPMRPGG